MKEITLEEAQMHFNYEKDLRQGTIQRTTFQHGRYILEKAGWQLSTYDLEIIWWRVGDFMEWTIKVEGTV